MSKSVLSIIAAHDINRGIGFKNDLPWHLPKDLIHFKKITRGKSVIMGRNTFDSIFARLSKPLPDRLNIVITSRKIDKQFSNLVTATNFDEALHIAMKQNKNEIFVIGGASLYEATLSLADKLYITEVQSKFLCDTYFPEYKKNFKLVSSIEAIDNNVQLSWNEYIRT